MTVLQEFGVALVPALMYILGDRNWQLPTWLNWLPRLNMEPAGPPEAPPSARQAALTTEER